MTAKLKVLFTLVLSGLLLAVLPVTWLYGADDDHAHSSDRDNMVSASVQFMLVHVEHETLERLMEESNTQTLDSIPLEKLGQCVRDKDGAQIVSQTRLSVVSLLGYPAEMNVVENAHRKAKTSEDGNAQRADRETKVSVKVEIERCDGNKLAARFVYDRSVSLEEYVMGEEAEEEEGIEQKFNISSGIVLQAGQMRIAGANLNEDMASVLIMKADF